jgi:hypothetical protein
MSAAHMLRCIYMSAACLYSGSTTQRQRSFEVSAVKINSISHERNPRIRSDELREAHRDLETFAAKKAWQNQQQNQHASVGGSQQ